MFYGIFLYSKTPIKYSLIQTGADDRKVTLAPPSSLVAGKEWNEPTEDTSDLLLPSKPKRYAR